MTFLKDIELCMNCRDLMKEVRNCSVKCLRLNVSVVVMKREVAHNIFLPFSLNNYSSLPFVLTTLV